MATKQQLAQYCADHFPATTKAIHLFSGVSTLTELIVGGVAVVIAFTLGWYIRGRGFAGVQIDLNNIKNDVENLKAKILPAPAVTAPVATVTN